MNFQHHIYNAVFVYYYVVYDPENRSNLNFFQNKEIYDYSFHGNIKKGHLFWISEENHKRRAYA